MEIMNCGYLIDKANQIKNDNKGNLAWHLRILNGNAGRYSRVIMIDSDLAEQNKSITTRKNQWFQITLC